MPQSSESSVTALTDTDYLVVDVETTGFSPRRGDRIIEAAVLRCRPGRGVIDRFTTLVDPERAIGASHVHRLHAHDLRGAPTFVGVAERLRARLSGGVVVAHNLRFDIAFLDAEFERAGHRRIDGPTLCTMELASRLDLPVPGRSLAACCEHFTIPLTAAHGAEHDAHATAKLLLHLLRDARAKGLGRLDDLALATGPEHTTPSPEATPHRPRAEAPTPARKPLRLVAAVRRVADTTPMGSPEAAAYLSLVDRVLLDGVLTATEADALIAMARRCCLDDNDVERLHVEYLRRLAEAAGWDGALGRDETEDLGAVAALLGVHMPEWRTPGDEQEMSWKR
jgi:DNA polymerase III subunit epsilon